jgi:methionine salvage enolase-phosphatase E1
MLKNEIIKQHIQGRIREHGFENNQIRIDFADLAEDKDVIQAATELGYNAEPATGAGCWWIYIAE